DMELEPYLVSSSVVLIVAQRLVKVICPTCKQQYTPDGKLLDEFKVYIDKLNIDKFYRGSGCAQCDCTGYLGRTGVFEILTINEEIKKLVANSSSEDLIYKEAVKSGFKPFVESGIEKVAKGLTTLDEILKVLGASRIEKADPVPAETNQGVAKILIVDDEDDVLKVLEKRFKTEGFQVVKAGNGNEAVEQTLREKPDLIVMDVMMPELDGYEATKILRSRLETASIPIVMLTAKREKDSELKGFDSGADDYISKPFDKDKLLARVKMLLKRRASNVRR
ncbi:response regulator, partial [Thermoproteota archaeon]